MATLEQTETTLKYHLGWYGKCLDDTLCANFDLTEAAAKEKLFKVFQINKLGDNYSYFDASLESPAMDKYQGFTELECGKIYLIVLKAGTGKLEIDNFTSTNIVSSDEIKFVTSDCENQDLLPMSNLSQSSKSLSYFMGWYGVCGEQCEELELTTPNVRNRLFRVFQINKFNDNYSIFDATYTTEQDEMGLQGFTKLECGNAYLIVLREGEGELELRNFIGTHVASTNAGSIIDECLSGPKGLAENTPRIRLLEDDIKLEDALWLDSIEPPKCDARLHNVNLTADKKSMSVEDISKSCGKSLVFDGVSGGYAHLPCYKEKPREVTLDISFTVATHVGNREIGDANQNSQYIAFQQNSRTDDNNAAYYLKYIEETEKRGKLEIGVNTKDGDAATASTASEFISVGKRYMVHAVFGDNTVQLYVNGDRVSSAVKATGIDYHSIHTLHLGRKRAIGNRDDAFFSGKIHAFALYAQALASDFIHITYLNDRCEPSRGVKFKACDVDWSPIEHPLFELSVPPTSTKRLGVKFKPCPGHVQMERPPAFVLPEPTVRPTTVGVTYEVSTGGCDTGGTSTSGIHGTIADAFVLPENTWVGGALLYDPTDQDADAVYPDTYGGTTDYI